MPETGFLPSLFVGLVAAFPLTVLAIVAGYPLLVLWVLLREGYDLLRQSDTRAKPRGPRGYPRPDALPERLDAERDAARERPRSPRLRAPLCTVPGSGRLAEAMNGLGPVAGLVLIVAPWLAFFGITALFPGDPAQASSLSPPLFLLGLLMTLTLSLWLAALLVLLRLAWRIAFPRQGADRRKRGVPL